MFLEFVRGRASTVLCFFLKRETEPTCRLRAPASLGNLEKNTKTDLQSTAAHRETVNASNPDPRNPPPNQVSNGKKGENPENRGKKL